MQTIIILGREFPLYLGVAAMEEMKERLGGVEEAAEALESEKDTFKKLDQGVTMIAILIRGGAEAYNFANPGKTPIVPPDESALRKVLTIADINRAEPLIVAAFNEGVGRTVFSMPNINEDNEKNSAGA